MRARDRSTRTGLALVIAGVVLAVAPVAVHAQTGDGGGGTLLSFGLSAESSGVAATFGNPAREPFPVAAVIVPESLTKLDTGPTGFALSSAAYPGPLLANAGTLANLLLPLCDPSGQACAPKPPPEAVNAANYPLRAQASSPGGTSEDTLGPMHAFAEGDETLARSTIADFGSSGIVSAGRIETISRSFLDDGDGVAFAESVLEDVSVAGGQVTLESLRSRVRVVTDGETSDVERELTVTGLEVGGQAATIDEEGVHFGDQGGENPAHEVVDPTNEELLSHFGIEVFLTRPVEERSEGGVARAHTGSLVVVWKLGDSGQEIVVSLGGAAGRARGAGGLASGGAPDVGGFFNPPFVGNPAAGDGSGGVQVSGGTMFPPSPRVGQAPAPQAAPGSAPTPSVGLDATFAREFAKGVTPGWALVWLLSAALVGMGLHRLRSGILDPAHVAATDCDQ